MLPVLLGIPFLVVAAVLYRRDARAWTNALPLLAGVLLVLGGLAGADASRHTFGGALSAAVVAALMLSPLAILVLTGYLIANGITMLRREGRSLGNLLSLAAGLGLLALIAWMAVSTLVLPGQRSFAAALAVVWVLTYPAVAFVAYLLASVVYGRRREVPAPHDIIVLGSSVASGRVPPLLAARLDRAVAQWREDAAAGFTSIIIPSGGQGADEPVAEGDAMAAYLVEKGVPAELVVVEDRARTTDENLRFSAALARTDERADRLVVVTSDYHAMRAAQLCRDLDLPAHVLGGRTARYFLPSAFLREFVAVMARQKWLHLVCMAAMAAHGLWFVLQV